MSSIDLKILSYILGSIHFCCFIKIAYTIKEVFVQTQIGSHQQGEHRYVVIMAGGSGKRLWPESRQHRPKQFQRIVSEKQSLLQETFERIMPLVSVNHVYVSTIAEYVGIVHEQLPQLPEKNIIIEPCSRDTAPALAYVSFVIAQEDSEAVILTIPSDHTMKDNVNFIRAVETGFVAVDVYPERIGLIGVKVTEPSTALGYIKVGSELRNDRFEQHVCEVDAFKEKPNQHIAKEYMFDLAYLWNAAYFIFYAETMLECIKAHAKDIRVAFTLFQNHFDDKKFVCEQFAALQSRPIDTVVLEKLSSQECFVVPASLRFWSDVGNWKSLHDHHCNGGSLRNITRGQVVAVKTEECLLYGDEDRVIVTLGLKGVIVVQTKDVTLISNRDHVEDIKKAVALLQQLGYGNLI